jgi:hypothetical protein
MEMSSQLHDLAALPSGKDLMTMTVRKLDEHITFLFLQVG